MTFPNNPEVGDTYVTSFTFNGIKTEYAYLFNGVEWVEMPKE